MKHVHALRGCVATLALLVSVTSQTSILAAQDTDGDTARLVAAMLGDTPLVDDLQSLTQ